MIAAAHKRGPTLLQAMRRRTAGRLRIVVLTLFALGIASQSLLAMLGSLHELTAPAHIAHEMAGHSDHLAPHDHAAAVQAGTDAEEGGTLHLLLHYTHCCSHSAWMSGGDAWIAVPALARADSPRDRTWPLPAPDLTAPFRPPITA